MAVRSLTSVFVMMRNNALQNKHISSYGGDDGGYGDEFDNDDTVALVSRGSKQQGRYSKSSIVQVQKPQFVEWAEQLGELKYEIELIVEKMTELNDLHDKHLKRPTLSDNTDEEQLIEKLTRDITEIFFGCKNTMKRMDQRKSRLTEQKQVLAQNMLSGNAIALQNLSQEFRQAQSGYLKKLKSREERSHEFFVDADDVELMIGQTNVEDDIDDVSFERGLSREQAQLAVNANTAMVETREGEIQSVVRSITELSEVFQDLGTIIVEQSSIIDRIDYNIENAVVSTEAGMVELKKAEKYQKKNRKMMVIVVMACITIVMLFFLIMKHS